MKIMIRKLSIALALAIAFFLMVAAAAWVFGQWVEFVVRHKLHFTVTMAPFIPVLAFFIYRKVLED